MLNNHTLGFYDFIKESSAMGEVNREEYKKIYLEIKKLYPNVYSVLFDKNGEFDKYIHFSNIVDVIINNEKYWIVTRFSYKTMKIRTNPKVDGGVEDLAVMVADKSEFEKYKDDSLFPERYIAYRSRYPEAMIDTVSTLKELRTPAKINFSKQ